ncbi:hypothetical protein [Streptomyces sp. NPDC002343]
MLPTERPLSPHRLVTPAPPARPQETTPPTRQTQPVSAVPVATPVSNATMAHATRLHPAPAGLSLLVGHDQSGNAAVATAAMRSVPGAAPLAMIVPQGAMPRS